MSYQSKEVPQTHNNYRVVKRNRKCLINKNFYVLQIKTQIKTSITLFKLFQKDVKIQEEGNIKKKKKKSYNKPTTIYKSKPIIS